MQVEIIFIKDGANQAFGGFARGGRARVSLELAKHFVDQAEVAVFASRQSKPVEPVAEPAVKVAELAQPEPQADAPRRGRPKKSL